MKLSLNEKRTLVAALSHALAQTANTQEFASYAYLRKKVETAIRNEAGG